MMVAAPSTATADDEKDGGYGSVDRKSNSESGSVDTVRKGEYCPADSDFPHFVMTRRNLYKTATESFVWDDGSRGVANVATHEWVIVFCKDDRNEVVKLLAFWLPLVTPDTVAYHWDLFAQVKGLLPDPTIEWLNIDIDHNWLWVNVDHYVGITADLSPQSASQTASNDFASATAWATATPQTLTFEVPGAEGPQHCDLATITAKQGCKIIFRHASVTSPTGDDLFHGNVTLTWLIETNADAYNGRTMTTTHDFTIQVAEAMAVTCPQTGCE